MKIFLDSADIYEIKEINELGIIDGVTTNPSLIAKAGADFKSIIIEICKAMNLDISVEVAANDFDGMIREGNQIIEISNNIVIKLPMTWDGVKACKCFT